jgi:non-heme chloroperoxidase
VKKSLCFLAALVILARGVYAQNIAGDWQGTLHAGPQQLRLIVQIAKSDSGGWTAKLYSIDQTTEPIPVSSVALEGPNVKLSVDAVRGTYEGKLSSDGNSIKGTWTQAAPLPLDLERATKETAWPIDPSPHQVQFIAVDNKQVKLEVLDWGGSGRPLVLLTGLGDNAHRYDRFAPKLTASYHVYGITRRGFGASSHPTDGYSADRLGDDVLEVIDALKLNHPVLVGHSIAGEELSSIGSRHPEKVAGLIYLDAGYSYAYYDRARGDFNIDLADLLGKLKRVNGPGDARPVIQDLLDAALPAFEKDLRQRKQELDAMPPSVLAAQASAPAPALPAQLIMAGLQKYTKIPVPILAIYALPHASGPGAANDAAARAAADARDEEITGAQAKAFETGVPTARVVRLPHANHYVFLSNEADVLREMNAFLKSLP